MYVNRSLRLLVALLAACTAKTATARMAAPLADRARAEPSGLELYLTAGKVAAVDPERVKAVAGRALAADRVAAVLARATPWPSVPLPTFAFRDKAPPLPGAATTAPAFPPPATAPAPAPAASGALHVVQWQPAPELAVVFDQPMPDAVPVTLTPQPKGQWRWIGTRTLVFEAAEPWPRATKFHAEIAAGTRSAGGGVLRDGASFAFETSAPRIVEQYPEASEPVRDGAAMALVFDQRIDRAAMLAHVRVTAGGQPIAIALADAHAVADRRLAAFVAAAERDGQAGRYVVFRATSPLPRDAEIAIEVAAGAPSAEGPLVTGDAQRVGFRTAAPAPNERPGERIAPAEPAVMPPALAGDSQRIAWYVVTDRAHYRASDIVRLKGWLRQRDHGALRALGDLATGVSCQVSDDRGSQIAAAIVQLSPSGGFDATLTLSRSSQPGPARVLLQANGKVHETYTFAIAIDDASKPEIAVAVHASAGPFVAGGAAELGATASYAAGDPVSEAPVQWYVTAAPAQFVPPGRGDYVFGRRAAPEPQEWALAGTTDASGAHALHLDLLSVPPATPMRVIARASVTGASRQTFTAAVPLLVHAASRYVGLRATPHERGQPIAIDAIAVDLDGKPVHGAKIEVVAQDASAARACEVVGEGTCRFASAERVIATIVDERGRINQTELELPAAAASRSRQPRERALAIHLAPSANVLALGEHVVIAADVRDAAGRAVPDAELAVIAVDEAQLAGYVPPDPFDVFYPARNSAAPRELPARPADVERAAPRTVLVPAVKTDSEGHATVDLEMPGDPARYHVVVLAAAGATQFGKAETTIVARQPLTVHARPPRFANAGDRFSVPVVVENHTDAPMTVDVAMRANDAPGTTGREVAVPANDRVEVDLAATAARPGRTVFQIVATDGSIDAAASFQLPVHAPVSAETVVQYGTLDRGAIRQPIALPAHVDPSFGGLEIEAASTPLQSLTDALLALVHDSRDGAEQRAARVLAIVALGAQLEQFHTKDMPSQSELFKLASADVARLAQLQNNDGGFASWQRGAPSDPFLTAFVTHALAVARSRIHVDPQLAERAHDYLRGIETHVPASYPDDVRHAISAYALYVRRRWLGDFDMSKAKQVYADSGAPEHASLETDAWLLATFAGFGEAAAERKALFAHLLAHAGDPASYGDRDGDALLLASPHRRDAVVLDALIAEAPNHDAIPKLVAALLARLEHGRSSSTQENVFAIAGLALYMASHDTGDNDFRARVWLGNDFAGDHAFVGRQFDRFEVDLPTAQVKPADLVIQNDGKGRLHYRVALTYAAPTAQLPPIEHGFVVRRRYEAIDDPRDVVRAADGAWHVRNGARVRVHVTIVNDDRRAQIALVDPLPAGLQAIAAASDPWVEHQDLRDDCAEAFASQLPPGVHAFAYVARAATPGEFDVSPSRAEVLYEPETFGRGELDRVIVETSP